MFDEPWYLEQYPEVVKMGCNPIEHYLQCGAAEGHDPSPHFKTKEYLNMYIDVAEDGANPLIHYIMYGENEERKSSVSRE